MKNIASFTILFVILSLLGCQETKESTPGTKDLSYYENVGHQIPVETGQRWIAAYNAANNIDASRISLSLYAVSDGNLNAVLQSLPNLLGVAFHHAIDDFGFHHFIVTPVDESFDPWSSVPGRIYLDANTDTEISATEARQWAARYENANPDEVWYHFFGKNIFEEIPTIPYFKSLNIVPALNDLDLSPQLLLIILNDGLLGLGGRVNDAGQVVYDASSPCPPCPAP
jgi:hypothetical protein